MNSTESFLGFVDRGDDVNMAAHSGVRLVTAILLRARLEASAAWRESPSDARRLLAVNGALCLPGLSADLVFRRHREKRALTEAARRVSSVLVPGGLTLPIPPQTLEFTPSADAGGAPLPVNSQRLAAAPEMGAGNGQGSATPLSAEVGLHATLELLFTPKERFWRRDAIVEFGGEIRFDRNVTATIPLDPSASEARSASRPVTAELVAMVAGTTLPVPFRSALVQLAPNPWISVQLLDARGQLEGEEHPLGRRVRIS